MQCLCYKFLNVQWFFLLFQGVNREEERRQHEKEESANESEIVTVLGRSVTSQSVKSNSLSGVKQYNQ